MKTKKILFMVSLLILGGISKGNAQSNYVVTTTATPATNQQNVTIGHNSGVSLLPTNNINYWNTFLGAFSGANASQQVGGEAARNVFIGYGAGSVTPFATAPLASGSDNVYIGSSSGRNAHTIFSSDGINYGTRNIGLGSMSAFNNQGNQNTLIGYGSGGDGSSNAPNKVLSGNLNTFLGYDTGYYNSSGNNNTFLGSFAGINNTVGSNNLSIVSSGPRESAEYNILMGIGAAPNCTGNNNVVVSSHRPNPSGSDTGLTSGSNNLFLGRVMLNAAATGSTSLGFDTNNSIILANGNGAQRLIISGTNGFAGFGLPNNTIPSNTLEVRSGVNGSNGTSGLRLTNLKSTNNVVPNPSVVPKVLSVDGNGDVILVNDAVGGTSTNNSWNLLGNAGTTPTLVRGDASNPISATENFIGTTDNQDLVIRRNNIRSGLLQAPGITPPGTRFMSVGNTAFGVDALSSTSLTGGSNTAMGVSSLLRNTTGIANVSFGTNSLMNSQSGIGNVAVGYNALGSLTNHPTFGGWLSNTAIGTYAGSRLVYGNGNVFIGLDAGATSTTNYDNRLYIDSDVNVNNRGNDTPLIFGDFRSRNLIFNLNNEDNTPNLTSRVTINSGGDNLSGLKFTDLNSTFNAPENTTNRFLTLNPAGDVVLESLSNNSVCNLYSCDGTIDTSSASGSGAGLRTVTMGENNLFFKTNGTFENQKPGTGRIYIGTNINFPLLNNIAPTNSSDPNISQYRLLVEGGILTEQVKVALRNPITDWRDNVFANEYKLMPLQEIATFISVNKHLPGIESAEELVKNGLDLGAMQAKQMGKIEELTLYAIEQDKKLQLQDKKLEQQSKQIEELKALVTALLEKK